MLKNWYEAKLFLISRKNLRHASLVGRLTHLEVVANSIGFFIACTLKQNGVDLDYVLGDCHGNIRYFKNYDTAHLEAMKARGPMFTVNTELMPTTINEKC
jgi:hypothetical protein